MRLTTRLLLVLSLAISFGLATKAEETNTAPQRLDKIHAIIAVICAQGYDCSKAQPCLGEEPDDSGKLVPVVLLASLHNGSFGIYDSNVKGLGFIDDGNGTPKYSFLHKAGETMIKYLEFAKASKGFQAILLKQYSDMLAIFATCHPVSGPPTAAPPGEPLKNIPPDSI